jgi:Peptidase family C25/Propeptide_C25/FlgD Ig-like domain
MKIKLLAYLLFLAFVPLEMNAEWISFDKSKGKQDAPKITILSDDNTGTTLKIDISGFDLKDFYSDKKTFQSVDLLTDVFVSKPGYPKLPYISKTLAIPDNANITVEVLETGEIHTFKNIHLPPARESWTEGEKETAFVENLEAYKASEIYPKQYGQVGVPCVFRDFRIARISVFPIRYFAAKNEIEVLSSITVRVNYLKGDQVINPKTSAPKPIAPSFAKLYRSFIFNYQDVLDRTYNGQETGHDVMLCIMPDEFAESFQSYAQWKNRSGTEIRITKFSDIGANANNPITIKDHISDAYQNWEHPPTYVLLVGDDGIFPKKIVDYGYSFASEDYFVEIEGDDFFPEMMIGRLTNQNEYELQVMLNKFMMYEKTPLTTDTSWFKKAVCCSNNAYASQVETKRFAANIMLEDGGFTAVDTLMCDGIDGSGCTVNIMDVRNAINEGRSFLNYRGEGWSDGWFANCYNFHTYSVSNINCGRKHPFITSIGCGVAMFDADAGNCFGEEWLQLGTLDSPRGAIAFVGPTSNTHTSYNNRIDKGIYVGMFQEGMDTPGQALLRGKLYMFNVFGNDPWVEYHYKVFCVLGDPSTHIWKDIPMEVNVVHPGSAPYGYSQPEFIITSVNTGNPLANAEVCIRGNEVFSTAYTDSTGKVRPGITPLSGDTLSVTVRGGKVIPYLGTINLVQSPEHVGPEHYPTIVDLDGNLDGLINPNENCKITFTLKNWGIQTANNVQASLTASDTNSIKIISTGSQSFGNLEPGASVCGDPFQFFVLPSCHVGQIITLELNISSTNTSWDYQYKEELMGCRIIHLGSFVNDEGAIIVNCRMDPGETVDLCLSLANNGEDIAPDVIGYLQSKDPFITIEDSIGTFGTISEGTSQVNAADQFRVSIDAACPKAYQAQFAVSVFTQNGNYAYGHICDFEIPVALPVSSDFTGPDEYGYYAYGSKDTLFEQAPDYEWIEIKELGTQIEVPLKSDYTETVDLPFDFQYYGIAYNQLRISTDGWAAFGEGQQTNHENTYMPNSDEINCMAAVFWDDLHGVYHEKGKIYHYHDVANNRFVVEWDSISVRFAANPSNEFFQLVLLDPAFYPTTTGDGELIFQYKKVVDPRSVTVGIENHSQDIGLQYVYDKDYDVTASYLKSGFALKFTTETPQIWVGLSPNESPGSNIRESHLEQNCPNPFRTSTLISYSISNPGMLSLTIFNMNGQLVRTIHKTHQQTGKHSIVWDGTNDNGTHLNSGIYFYQLRTGNFIENKKMFLLK